MDSVAPLDHHEWMLKPGDFVIVTSRGARHLRSEQLDERMRALLVTLVETEARDLPIERAIEAMTSKPAHRWTVAALAKIAGLSRAPFCRRFIAVTGAPPLKHLTALRMQIAAARLRESDDSLSIVGESVGYLSEFAFAKAFKRHFGRAPGSFRRDTFTANAMMRAA